MGRPYSQDLRSRIVAAVEAGTSRNKAAQQFAVSVSCVAKLMQRWQRTRTIVPSARGKKPYALAEHGDSSQTDGDAPRFHASSPPAAGRPTVNETIFHRGIANALVDLIGHHPAHEKDLLRAIIPPKRVSRPTNAAAATDGSSFSD